MSIFYRDLNHERIQDRWVDWEGHRQEINLLISRSLADGYQRNRAIVLGAGNCDDLDLYYFCNIFEQMTLVDIDALSLQEGVNRLAPELLDRIQLLGNIDFTKLDQVNFYSRFNDLLERKALTTEISCFLTQTPSEIVRCSLLEPWRGQYSVVISSAVYTQIFYIHVLTLLAVHASSYTAEEITVLMDGLKTLRDCMVKAYNDLMLDLLEEGGTIIAWSDVVKFDEQSPFPEEQFYAINNEMERMQFMFDLASKQGREAALTGLHDLHGRLHSQDRQFACWIWPYSSNRQYITFGISGKIVKGTT
ncbi:hypothetical protein [Paenibacillus periandrae]|uniref:hypothetical protein n=1 Tax=Paenibacillus periandrae TaxID=1761741 RepID=UPI001F08C0C1|nr:hypothetical protein [Paenibacillus periandrae]